MDQLEDCTNCPGDCGMCPLNSCGESLTCVFGCFGGGFPGGGGGGGGPPIPDIFCMTGCINQTCPDSRVFLMEVINCAVGAFVGGTCMDFGCVMSECRSQILRCLSDRTSC